MFLKVVFYLDILVLLILFIGLIISIARPAKRIWPPPGTASWQYRTIWTLFYLAFVFNFLIMFWDWNSWIFPSPLRFITGIPLALLGSSLLIWGIWHLGVTNTSGVSEGFITSGPYRFTRNPQYLGDIVLFLGLSISTNSLHLWITHGLLILIFMITPLAEEDWLREQYGENYQTYLEGSSRFM